jgi:hypothetical protein
MIDPREFEPLLCFPWDEHPASVPLTHDEAATAISYSSDFPVGLSIEALSVGAASAGLATSAGSCSISNGPRNSRTVSDAANARGAAEACLA